MFEFRLKTVLRYRGHITRQRQQALAEQERLLQGEKRELQALLASRGRARDLLAEYRSSPSLPLPEVMVCGDYLRAACRHIGRQTVVVDDAREHVEEGRTKLAEALKAQRIIQKLRDRQRARYLKRGRRRERARLDEVASRFHPRTRDEGLIGSV